MISYGATSSSPGIPLLSETSLAENKIDAIITERHAQFFELLQWAGFELQKLAFRPPRSLQPLRINEWIWPRGATRWSTALCLADDATLARIRALVSPITNSGFDGPVHGYGPLNLRFDDGRTDPATGSPVGRIEAEMFLLPPRPLFQIGPTFFDPSVVPNPAEARQLYLLTFVDDRFFWPSMAGQLDNTNWISLFNSLRNGLNLVRYIQDPVLPEYLLPSDAFRLNRQN